MCFGKAIAAESVELPEGLLCEFGRIAALDHAGDQLLLELRDPAGVLESRHSAAELIGFRRREARAFDRNAHRLFLEERDAERLAEHAFQFGLRIFDLLGAGEATKIGMDHVALDRTGPDDRDLRSEEHTSEPQSLMRNSVA